MKLSVSLSDEVAVLDAYVKKAALPSRSAGLQRAVQMLRYPDLEDDTPNRGRNGRQARIPPCRTPPLETA